MEEEHAESDREHEERYAQLRAEFDGHKEDLLLEQAQAASQVVLAEPGSAAEVTQLRSLLRSTMENLERKERDSKLKEKEYKEQINELSAKCDGMETAQSSQRIWQGRVWQDSCGKRFRK